MRALLDANIFLSYLLDRTSNTLPIVVVDAALNGSYTLLVTARGIDEVRDKAKTKPYLAARIAQHQVERLVTILTPIAENIPELGDRKDDYLFAHAIFGKADYLVSGDTGVKKVRQIGSVRIVSPAGFVQVLDLAPPNP
jgi:predicted nucleic acid-binding protein